MKIKWCAALCFARISELDSFLKSTIQWFLHVRGLSWREYSDTDVSSRRWDWATYQMLAVILRQRRGDFRSCVTICGIRCRGCSCIVNREMSPNNRVPAKLDTGLLPPEVDSSTFVWFTAVVGVTEQATNSPRFSDLRVLEVIYAFLLC